MTIRPSTALLAALVGVVLFAAPIATAQTLRVSLETLTQDADDIIVGRTLRTESYWTDDRSAILTDVIIDVSESLTGGPTGERIVTVPGGQVGEYLHEVSDMPVFIADEEVVVFTTRHAASGLTIVAGGSQGKMEVTRDASTGVLSVAGAAHLMRDEAPAGLQKQEGFEVVDANEARVAVPLVDFVKRVKGTVTDER